MSRLDLSKTHVYIAGVAETPLGEVRDHSELSMVALAAREALAEAGLGFGDVDAVLTNYMGEEASVQVGEYLGITPRYADSSDLGGAAFDAFVHHATCAIALGRCEVALIAFASRQRTRRTRGLLHPNDPSSLTAQFQDPYGLPMPIGHYALIAARHMHQYGTTSEQLAEVAVAARKWAQLNPKAWKRDPLTIDDVLASPIISEPLHRLDCCLITDGGAVAVVTNEAHARNAAKRAIRVLGAGEAHHHWHISQMHDLTITPGVISGREAFGMAGIQPDDIDILEPYDAFTINVILTLEDLGFCKKGEGGPFVEKGALVPGGVLPSMTNGGGLSYNHPGAYGLMILVEAVRQLRGEAEARQVPNAELAVVHGIGGLMSATGTVVLARE